MGYRVVLALATVYPVLVSLYGLGMLAIFPLLNGLESLRALYPASVALFSTLATAVFFAALYEEASGSISARARRKAVLVATVLSCMGVGLTVLATYTGQIPGYSGAYRSLVGYLGRVAWIALFVVFARESAPLGKRVTSYLCVLMAALTVYGVFTAVVRMVQPFTRGVPFRLGLNAVLGLVVLPVLGILNSAVLFVFFVMVLRRRPALPVAD